MKKIFSIFLISAALVGCSSLELGDALSSEQYTQKILALGLSHEENLAEAKKLKTPHLVSIVSLQLVNARDEKIQNEIDLTESEQFANQVKISNNGLRFTGSELSESIKTGVLETDFDLNSYYLEGIKESNSKTIKHKLHLMISHNSKNKREYFSANICNTWGRCEDLKEDGTNNQLELIANSANASNCTSSSCDYTESVEIILSDNLLNESIHKGLNLKLISKKKSHKIKVSKPYIMGYLRVAN
jgi:hypothetical protein